MLPLDEILPTGTRNPPIASLGNEAFAEEAPANPPFF